MNSPSSAIAEAFARHLKQWVTAQQLPADLADLLVAAGHRVAARTDEGHVCVALAEVAASVGRDLEWTRQGLLTSGLVGTPTDRGGVLLVLDESDRLYLHRYFDYETRLGARLARALAAPVSMPGAAGKACLAAQFGTPASDGGQWQALAAALALLRRVMVISGGPGTGKTTTVAKLLACLVADTPTLRIALAAPTGKAAARLGASLGRTAGLPPELQARLRTPPMTVHRLLGYGPSGFRHHAGARLPFDVVVIDEASMLDVSLATRLLEAVPEHARIVLLGDRNQLEAVESGAVFAELCATHSLSAPVQSLLAQLVGVSTAAVDAPIDPTDALADAVIWFARNYRFAADSPIGQLAVAIQTGQADRALAVLEGGHAALQWRALATKSSDAVALADLQAGYAPYVACIGNPATRPADALKCFDGYRVLAATRDGPWGVVTLNERLSQPLREGRADRSPWYPGRPVLITRNDPVVGLFNGDIGIALADEDGTLRVWFEGETAPRGFAPSQLPPHETAFAMTIHKSQGSEFAAVAVVLPQAQSALLSRELIYTGITRARERVMLIGSRASLETAIARPSARISGLRDRIRAAAAALSP